MADIKSSELFSRAKARIPGGVNSPVRAFRAVGGDPIFIARAEGAYLYDADGVKYTDYIGSWGPMILGHAHKAVIAAIADAATRGTSFGAPTALEVEFAEKIGELYPSIEMMRAVSSGTEATMAALRVARGFTGRDVIVKFEGCYHGHADFPARESGLGRGDVRRSRFCGSACRNSGQHRDPRLQRSPGATRALFAEKGSSIAAVIVEPVVGNMGVVPPEAGFLEEIIALCKKHGAVSIFDEVMTGSRVARGGMQERAGLAPGHDVPRQDHRRRNAARGVRRSSRHHGEGRADWSRLPSRHAERKSGVRQRGARAHRAPRCEGLRAARRVR